jgi:hypothetical protein
MPDAGATPDEAARGRRDLPRYDDLPRAGRGGRTDASVQAATALVRKGTVFALSAELDAADPDVLDNFFPRISSQWDSLARRGIVGRGILLDLDRALNDGGRSYTPDGATAFTVADLEHARAHAGVDFSPGDILLLRTGFLGWYRGQPRRQRLRLAADLRAPGLEHTEGMTRYLWDSQVMAVASDGMALGELWWLDDLAADCDQDGVYEFFLTSAPLNLPGGIGSPPNALAIK